MPSSSPPTPGRNAPGLRVAELHVEGVDAVVHAVGDELGKHHRSQAVDGGVADVVLPRGTERGVEHKFPGGVVVRCGGGDAGHVGAVPGFGHGEAAGDLQVHDAGQPVGVVGFGAQVHHGGAEQSPLDAGLDLQRRVGHHQFLEAGDVPAVVVRPAQVGREGPVHGAVVHQELQLACHAGPVLGVCQAFGLVQLRPAGQIAGLVPDRGPFAQQLFPEGGRVHGRLASWRRAGAWCGRTVNYVSHVSPSLVVTGRMWLAAGAGRSAATPTQSQVVICRAMVFLARLGGGVGRAQPLFAGIPDQPDRCLRPVADDRFLAFAQVRTHGHGDHVGDRIEEVAQRARGCRRPGRGVRARPRRSG